MTTATATILTIVSCFMGFEWVSLMLCMLLTAGIVSWAICVYRVDTNTTPHGEVPSSTSTDYPTATTINSNNNNNNNTPSQEYNQHNLPTSTKSSACSTKSISFVVDVDPNDVTTISTSQKQPQSPPSMLVAALVGTGSHLAVVLSGLAMGIMISNRGIMYPEYPNTDTLVAVSQTIFNLYASTSFVGGVVAMITSYVMIPKGVVLSATQRLLTMTLTATLFPGLMIVTGVVLGHLCKTDRFDDAPLLASSSAFTALYFILQQWLYVSIPLCFVGAYGVEMMFLRPSTNTNHKNNATKIIDGAVVFEPTVAVPTSGASPPPQSPTIVRSCIIKRAVSVPWGIIAPLCIGLTPFVIVLPQIRLLLLLRPVDSNTTNNAATTTTTTVASDGEEYINMSFSQRNVVGFVHITLYYISIVAASIALCRILRTGHWGKWFVGVAPAVHIYAYCLMSYFRSPPPSHLHLRNEPTFAGTYFCIYTAMLCTSLGLAGGAVAFWATVWAAPTLPPIYHPTTKKILL